MAVKVFINNLDCALQTPQPSRGRLCGARLLAFAATTLPTERESFVAQESTERSMLSETMSRRRC